MIRFINIVLHTLLFLVDHIKVTIVELGAWTIDNKYSFINCVNIILPKIFEITYDCQRNQYQTMFSKIACFEAKLLLKI